MAFYNEEYSNTRKEWISNNQDFYNSKIENAKTLEVGGLLHMYQLALENMPVNPLSPKAGEYGKVVKKYHKLIHSTFGVKTLIAGANSLSAFFMSNEEAILFSTSWLIHGDFYENLVYQIIDSYNKPGFKKKEVLLKELKNRIIYESILLGVRTLEDWQKYHRDMNEIKGWTIVPDDFVAPTPFDPEKEACQEEPPQKENKTEKNKEREKDIAPNTFFSMLKCDDSIKEGVIKILADEIVSSNTKDRIANIRFALERKKWIDNEISFLQFYNAFAQAIKPFTEEGFHLISRNKGSKVYYNNPTLLLHEQKEQLNAEEEQRLFEVERICKLLDDLKSNAEKAIETEGS
jgi:hypothetical protein